MTLIASLAAHARSTPDKPFLVHGEDGRYTVLTFSDVLQAASCMANVFTAQRDANSRSDVVFLFLRHHPLQLPVYLAVMLSGMVPSFMSFPSAKQDPALFWKTHQDLIRRVEPAVIVAYRDLVDELEAMTDGSTTKVLALEDLVLGTSPAGRAADVTPALEYMGSDGPRASGRLRAPAPSDIALLQHSSGTTGLKKGVALTFGQVDEQSRLYAAKVGLSESSVVVSWLPYYHDMGLFTAFLIPLTVGATVVSTDAFAWVARPASLFELIERFRGSHCWLPNFAFQHLVNTIPSAGPDVRSYRLGSIETFVSCSEPVKAATLSAFAAHFAPFGVMPEHLSACYAMAETGFAVTQSPPGQPAPVRWYAGNLLARTGRAVEVGADHPQARALVSNGPPLPGIEVSVRSLRNPDPTLFGNSQMAGAPVGEIVVRGEVVFSGYYNQPGVTEAAFDGEWYRTGDVGFLDGGELFVSGRVKDVIIVHGRNYYAHDIEEIVSGECGVLPGRAVAVGLPNVAAGSEDVVILLETRLETDSEERALKRSVKRSIFDRLELTVRSVHVVRPGWLVKTSSGKMSRSENLTRFQAEFEGIGSSIHD